MSEKKRARLRVPAVVGKSTVPIAKRPNAKAYARRITAEIEARREKMKLNVKQAAAMIGIDRKTWYKKVGTSLRWSVGDLDAIAQAFDAPSGWPLIPWELAESFDAWRKRGG